jgi:hypothetical protein
MTVTERLPQGREARLVEARPMKPIVRNAILIASLWPVVLLSSLVVDSFPFAPGHRSTTARAAREDVTAMASNDSPIGSATIALSTGSRSWTNIDALGAGAQPLVSRRMSCVEL